MKTTRPGTSARPAPARELAELRLRLADAEGTLRAIRLGEVDTVMVAGKEGSQVFTLEGAEHAYRVLIESMSEGALMLTAGKVILYANQCFARMIGSPLAQVIGSSFRRFLSGEGRAALRPLLRRTRKPGAKIQVMLRAGDGSHLPVQISVWPLGSNALKRVTFGLVVTDLTEARRTEELMRALTHRVVEMQEAERAGLALELHDHITQMLCGTLFRCQVLVDGLAACDGSSVNDALRLREMLSKTAAEVERIAHDLRPGALDQLGLVAVLHTTGTEFTARTGVTLKLKCGPMVARLPAEIELALYRILQEALKNVEQYAHARNVTVHLASRIGLVQLTIKDDGVGFDPQRYRIHRKGQGGLGLLGMRERAGYVGGALEVTSTRRRGTEIEVRIPLPGTTVATPRKQGGRKTNRHPQRKRHDAGGRPAV